MTRGSFVRRVGAARRVREPPPSLRVARTAPPPERGLIADVAVLDVVKGERATRARDVLIANGRIAAITPAGGERAAARERS